jgi:hypothetical protein
MYFRKIRLGPKSIMNSLSLTPDLSKGLVNDLKDQALARNPFLFIIPDTHTIIILNLLHNSKYCFIFIERLC